MTLKTLNLSSFWPFFSLPGNEEQKKAMLEIVWGLFMSPFRRFAELVLSSVLIAIYVISSALDGHEIF